MKMMTIDGWPEAIPNARNTVLDAALGAGVPIDHQCRAGECGRCRCRLMSGDVRQLPAMPGALDDADRSQGWILACRSVPITDVTIALPELPLAARPRSQQMSGVVIQCRNVAPEIFQVIVEPERPLAFMAGQYVTLGFAGLEGRSYSPSNAPGASLLSFLIRIVPDGQVSAHIAKVLRLGDECLIDGPYGSACLSEPPEGPVLLVGGGTGLAPMLSILGSLAEHSPGTECDLYIGARQPDDLLARNDLARLAKLMPRLTVTPIFSNWAPEGALQGFIAPVISDRHDDLAGHDVFIAGPPPLMESVEREAIKLGAVPERVRSDPFVSQTRKAGPIPSFGLGKLRSFLVR